MLFYYIPQYKSLLFVIPVLEVTVCVLVIITILIFRPYKRNIHSFNEVLLFIVLRIFSCYFSYANVLSEKLLHFWYRVFILPVIGSIILFLVLPYLVYWMVSKCQAKYRYSRFYNTSVSNPQTSTDTHHTLPLLDHNMIDKNGSKND